MLESELLSWIFDHQIWDFLQAAGNEEPAWVTKLLNYFAAVLYKSEVVLPDSDFADDVQQPPVPAEFFTAVFTGAIQMLFALSNARLQPFSMETILKLQYIESRVGLRVYAYIRSDLLNSGICNYISPNCEPS